MYTKKIIYLLIIIIGFFLNNCSNAIYVEKTNYLVELNKSTLSKGGTVDIFEDQLIKKANRLLNKDFKSPLDKKLIPPSNDMHDYLSYAIYYWPDKNSRDKTWKFIDGKVNKNNLIQTDHQNYYNALDAIKTLSLSYYLTNKNDFAEKCLELLKLWFIDDSTRLNPNFNYAQAIPQKNTGTPSGIIDARGILWVIDAIEFIRDSNFWTVNMDIKFKDWCSELLDWLLKSRFGKREGQMKNNHGTFYELQVIKLSSYLNKFDIAIEFFEKVKKRITWQIEPDGSQPLEQKRTSAHMYSVFNLSALLEICLIAKQYNIDLWTYQTVDCGSVKDAVDFLVKKYKIDDRNSFNGKVSYKNLLRLLTKANRLLDYDEKDVEYEILQDSKNVDLTHLYFSN